MQSYQTMQIKPSAVSSVALAVGRIVSHKLLFTIVIISCGIECILASTDTGCYPKFTPGLPYVAESKISAASAITVIEDCSDGEAGCSSGQKSTTSVVWYNYECVSGPNSQFCSQVGYDPAGIHGSIAWTKLHECSVRNV